MWPNAYFSDPGGYAVILGDTSRRDIEGCRASITILAPGASRSWWFCGFPQQFLQRAWVDGTVKPPLCGRPRAGGGGGYPRATNLLHRIYPTSGGAGESTKGLCPRCRDPYCGPHRGTLKKILYGKRRRILEPYGVEPGSVPRPACGSDLRYEYRYHQLSPCGAARRGGIRRSRLRRAEAFRAAPDAYGPLQFRLCGAVGYRSIQPRMDAMKGWLRRNYPPRKMVSALTPSTQTPPTNGFGDTVTGYGCFEGEPRPRSRPTGKGNVPEEGLGLWSMLPRRSSTDGVPVKATPPVPVLPAPPPATAVTTTMVVEAPGLVTKSALHPPLPISGNYQCARSSGNGEPCPYNFESQCGYIYDRRDWRLRVGLAILAIPDHTAGYAPHSPWFSTTRYSGKLSELFRRREIRTTSLRC